MAADYNAFFIRQWQTSTGETRVVVEQIRNGQVFTTSSLAQALTWLQQQLTPATGSSAQPAA